MHRSLTTFVFISLGSIAACSSDAGSASLTLSAMVPGNSVAGALTSVSATPSASGLTLSDGQNTLVLSSAEVILRSIKFETADGDVGCGAASDSQGEANGEGECEDFKAEPMILALPLDGSVSRQVTANVAPGSYKKIAFKVHKLGGEAADQAILGGRPELRGVSVLVKGAINGAAFTYTSDVEAEQEIELSPPMQVTADSGQAGLTLAVDASGWFVSAGKVLDPRKAGHDGAYEETVKKNIEASFEGFEDDDHDGKRHSEDSDEKD